MQKESYEKVLIVGAGLAGSEAAYFLAERGVKVILCEVKRKLKGPHQKSVDFGELVCTNSLKSKNLHSAHGILKYEMEKLGSLVLKVARKNEVPAGDALAVDREEFAKAITSELTNHPNIEILDTEMVDPISAAKEWGCTYTILASGPLTTEKLSRWIKNTIGNDDLYFYDAIAPVVDADSLDESILYAKDRNKETEVSMDYLNAPLEKEEYFKLMEELVKAEKTPAKDFEEEKFFESCLPIDLMAERGVHTARFSCMKPIGLEKPDGSRPYAVVQLRKENLLGSAYNLVGFQTRLKYGEQTRVLRMIPGFEKAQFIHLGSVHRNTFLNACKLLNDDLSSKEFPRLFFAGQMTGVEGYTESASMGLYTAWQVYLRMRGKSAFKLPLETAMGALVHYIRTMERPAPSNINFGLFPEVELKKRMNRLERKKYKRRLISERAFKSFDLFWESHHP